MAGRPRPGVCVRGGRAVYVSNVAPVPSVSGQLVAGCCLVSELHVGSTFFLFISTVMLLSREVSSVS